MVLDQPTRILAHCEEIRDDDGLNPKEFFKSGTRRKANRKTKQLCRQVARTLEFVLAGDGHDDVLQDLLVLSVEPAPDASRLLVTVVADVSDDRFDRPAILRRLDDHMGRLRSEVAASITRKRVPTLAFNVIAAGRNNIDPR